ncbi:MAG: hypothetical protein GY826_22545 [Fuerstiella sp.]|nr:hypothetical protein [Fuerstiella sp.]
MPFSLPVPRKESMYSFGEFDFERHPRKQLTLLRSRSDNSTVDDSIMNYVNKNGTPLLVPRVFITSRG